MRGTRGELEKRKTVAAAMRKVIGKRKKSEASKYVARPGELCYGIGGKPCVASVESSERDGTKGFDIARFPVHFEGVCLKCWEVASPRGECPCQECASSRKGVYTCLGTSLFECPRFVSVESRVTYSKKWPHGVCSACATAWSNVRKAKKCSGTVTHRVVYGGNHALEGKEVEFRSGKSLEDCVSSNPVPYDTKDEDDEGCNATDVHPFYTTGLITCALCDDIHAAEYRHFGRVSDGGMSYNLCLQCQEGVDKLITTIGGEKQLHLVEEIHHLMIKKKVKPMKTRSSNSKLEACFDTKNLAEVLGGNACRFLFRFSRVSTLGGQLAHAAMAVNDVLCLFDRRRIQSSGILPIFPGQGPLLIVPEMYSKSGSALHTLTKSRTALPPLPTDSTGVKFQMHHGLRFAEMVEHVNFVTAHYAHASVTLMLGTIADFAVNYSHLLQALLVFDQPERIFILVGKIEDNHTITVCLAELIKRLQHPSGLQGTDDASRVVRQCHVMAFELLRGGGSKKRTGVATMPHIDTLAKATQSQSSGAIPSQHSAELMVGQEMFDVRNTRSSKSKMRIPILLHQTNANVQAQGVTTGSEDGNRDFMDELKMLGRVARKLTKPPANESYRWWTFDEDEDERVASETKSSSLEKRKKSVEESNPSVGQQVSNAGRISGDKEASGGSGSKRRRVSWSPTIQGYAPDASLDWLLGSQETTLTSPPPRGRRTREEE